MSIRIKGFLFAQRIRGLNVKSNYKALQIEKLVRGEARPLPPRLASSPHQSGDKERRQSIWRTWRSEVHASMTQEAWLWLKHQPKSAITRGLCDERLGRISGAGTPLLLHKAQNAAAEN